MKLTCVNCGAEFTAKSRHRKLCNKACREQRAKAQRVAWVAEHKTEMADYWRRYHVEHQAERSAQAHDRYIRKTRRAA